MLIVTAACFIAFATKATKYFNWKMGVDDYLRKVNELGDHQLKLTPLTFELVNKTETVIEKWSAIKKVSITAELITLNTESGPGYQFPAKTMDPANYQLLQDFIRQQVQFA